MVGFFRAESRRKQVPLILSPMITMKEPVIHVKAQLCRFLRKPEGQWEFGVALVKEIGMHDTITILDAFGKKVGSCWNYDLVNHPIGTAIDSSKL